MNVTITGPNAHGGMFHVHAAGCRDLDRGVYRQLAQHSARAGFPVERYEEEHPSVQAVVESVYSDMIDEFDTGDTWEDYLGEFKFFPCVDLPR